MALDSFDSETLSDAVVDDWPAKASNTVVRYVDTVRSTTTGPALVASRYVVYVLAIALIAMVLAVLALVTLGRALVVATEMLSFVGEDEPWMAYYIMGGLFLLLGIIFWRKKEAKSPS